MMSTITTQGYNSGYRYKGLSLLEPESGKSGAWSSGQKVSNIINSCTILGICFLYRIPITIGIFLIIKRLTELNQS